MGEGRGGDCLKDAARPIPLGAVCRQFTERLLRVHKRLPSCVGLYQPAGANPRPMFGDVGVVCRGV